VTFSWILFFSYQDDARYNTHQILHIKRQGSSSTGNQADKSGQTDGRSCHKYLAFSRLI